MSDPHLPVVPVPPSDVAERGDTLPVEPVSTEGGDAGTSPSTPRRGGRWARLGAFVFVVLVGLLVSLGVASLVGDPVRKAVLIELDASPVGSEPSLSDAPTEAARFFADRDTVLVRIPWDMTVADFLSLYHLETNAGARAALRDQLGASTDQDVLREGDELSITLTVTRPGG